MVMQLQSDEMASQRPRMDLAGAPPPKPPPKGMLPPHVVAALKGETPTTKGSINPTDLIANLLPQLPAYQQAGPAGVDAPGVNINPYLSADYNTIAKFGSRTPNELQSMQNVSELARLMSNQGRGLFDVGSPAYGQALQYYRTLLGGDRGALAGAIAPEAEAMSEIYSGAEKSLEGGALRGGAREAAQGELSRRRAGDIASLVPKARQMAAAQAGQMGLAGAQMGLGAEQTGGSMYDQLLGQEAANRYQAIGSAQGQQGLGLQATLGQGQHELGRAGLRLQDILGHRQIGLQEYLGQAGLGMDRAQFGLGAQDLALRERLGLGGLDLQKQQLLQEQKRYEQEQKAKKGSVIGKIIGTALPIVGGLVGGPVGGLIGGAAGNLIGGGGGGLGLGSAAAGMKGGGMPMPGGDFFGDVSWGAG